MLLDVILRRSATSSWKWPWTTCSRIDPMRRQRLALDRGEVMAVLRRGDRAGAGKGRHYDGGGEARPWSRLRGVGTRNGQRLAGHAQRSCASVKVALRRASSIPDSHPRRQPVSSAKWSSPGPLAGLSLSEVVFARPFFARRFSPGEMATELLIPILGSRR
jgi:hypothetical protein